MILLAEIVDLSALAQTALAALVAGVGLTLTFSLAIYGFGRSADLRNAGRDGPAVALAVLGSAALLVSIAGIVVGLLVMVTE